MELSILLNFLPWIVLIVLKPTAGLCWATGMAGISVFAMNRLQRLSMRLLDKATSCFFAACFFMALFMREQNWVLANITAAGNIYLAAIVAITIFTRNPFTIEYAKEKVSREQSNTEDFMFVNYVLAYAWLIYFLINAFFYVAMSNSHCSNTLTACVVQVVALFGVMIFSKIFLRRVMSYS